MRRSPFVISLLLSTAAFASAQDGTAPTSNEQVDRGRYLVEEVARCPACHTPRDDEGELDEGRWLEGGAHGYEPVHENGDWALIAPGLRGLPGGYSREELIRFLMTGKTPRDRTPDPPMKQYRLSREDAEAITAYLESLSRDPFH